MAQQHDDPYDLALNDPEFLEAVRSHHAGSWDVLDALWWASHPLDTTPGGVLAPLARVRALQRRVFAADADAAGDHRVHDDLRRLEAEIAREMAAIDAAVLAAQTGVGAALAENREAAGADDADAGEPADATGFETGLDAPAPAGTGRRRALLAAGLTAAVLLGVVVGGQLSAATLLGAAPAASAEASATATPPPVAMSIFQREPMTEDILAVSLPAEFDMSTVRALGSMGTVDADPVWTTYYYVARTTSKLVCLIVVPPKSSFLSTCTLEQDFPSTGLRLYWQAQGIFADTGAATGPVNTFLTWRPDGSVETGAVGAGG